MLTRVAVGYFPGAPILMWLSASEAREGDMSDLKLAALHSDAFICCLFLFLFS